MSVIATVEADADDVMLGAALSRNPGLRVRLERVVPIQDSFMPYIWASDDDIAVIRTHLEEDPSVVEFAEVDEANGEVLLRVEWAESAGELFALLSETGGSVLEAVGENERWRFELRFEEHTDLTRFYRGCVERGIPIDLESVHNPGIPHEFVGGVELTDAQEETLRVALEEGYFDVPRGIDLTGLAEKLGISDSAVSQRLRRGTQRVLLATLRDQGRDR